MTEYREVGEKERARWDELALHPMQSWAWGEFRSQRQPINRIGIYEDGILKRGYLVVWTKIPKLPYYFGYIPMSGWPSEEDARQLVIAGKKRKALGIRLEPAVRVQESSKEQDTRYKLRKGRGLFKKKTYWWDLQLSEAELLAQMHQKARYNIKIAAKHEVHTQEDNSPAAFETYCRLLFGGTAKRQKVGMHNTTYQQTLWKVLRAAGIARLFTATYEGTMLSAMLVFVWKDTAYYAYGANSLEHKEVMAPTALVWQVAKTMKAAGYARFDLWGAEEGKGFSRFKEQFGAELVELAGSWDIAVKPVEYTLFRLAEEVRWHIRHR